MHQILSEVFQPTSSTFLCRSPRDSPVISMSCCMIIAILLSELLRSLKVQWNNHLNPCWKCNFPEYVFNLMCSRDFINFMITFFVIGMHPSFLPIRLVITMHVNLIIMSVSWAVSCYVDVFPEFRLTWHVYSRLFEYAFPC